MFWGSTEYVYVRLARIQDDHLASGARKENTLHDLGFNVVNLVINIFKIY